MSDLPARISITEEGPREGFQIEPGPITTAGKLELINALSNTGLSHIQVCSFVSPRLVPGWADADEVVAQLAPSAELRYSALWFNARGLERALRHADTLHLTGTIHTVASEAFSLSNLNRTREQNLVAMREQTLAHGKAKVPVNKISVMAAFGCNFQGDVAVAEAVQAVRDGFNIAAECDASIEEIALADTMGWANPLQIYTVVNHVRELWPDIPLRLHLHDTRGLGIANAFAALQCGVDRFDTTVGGLGGCPFAARQTATPSSEKQSDALPGSRCAQLAPGNIATEELVLLAMEMGIETGIDLDALIDVGRRAERIVGHPLPSAALRGGSLSGYRANQSNNH